MALVERLMGWTEEDIKIPIDPFCSLLEEFNAEADGVSVPYIKSLYDMDEATEEEFDVLMDTRPGPLLGVLARADWVRSIRNVLFLAEARDEIDLYDTPTKVRTRLELS